MIEFTLRGLPPTPNQRMHWAVKAKHNQYWRQYTTLMAAPMKDCVPLKSCTLTLIRYSSRACDIDNAIASFKPIIDGLRDAKIIADDNPNVVKQINYEWVKAPRKDAHVKIIVSPL